MAGETISASRVIGTRRGGWSDRGYTPIDVRPVVVSRPDHVVVFVLGGDVMKNLQPEKSFPEHMYVDVPTIAKTTSALVLLVCLFSLIVSWATGFNMIYPLIAAFVLIGAGVFYAMGRLLAKRSTH